MKTKLEDVLLRLEKKKTTVPRFRWNVTHQGAVAVLEKAYQCEVEKRGRTYAKSDELNSIIAHLAALVTNPGYKFGAVLCGTYGNGKTTLLYALQQATNHLADMGVCPANMGIQIIDAVELAYLAKDYTKFKTKRDYPVLGIEDMGREPMQVMDYGNRLSPIIELLEYRYAHQLPTFITTNLAPKDISKEYDERIASRFRETMEVIEFPDLAYRGKRN